MTLLSFAHMGNAALEPVAMFVGVAAVAVGGHLFVIVMNGYFMELFG